MIHFDSTEELIVYVILQHLGVYIQKYSDIQVLKVNNYIYYKVFVAYLYFGIDQFQQESYGWQYVTLYKIYIV